MRVLLALLVTTLMVATPVQSLIDEHAVAPSSTQKSEAPALLAGSGASAEVAPVAPVQPPVQTPAELLARIGSDLGVRHDKAGAPESLRNLAVLVAMQPNGTNGTVLAEPNGTATHQHSHLGEQGLSPVWAAPFHGIARHMAHTDLDGDGTIDTVIGSDIAVTALSGRDGSLLWAQHIGSRVSALFETDIGGQPHIVFATHWDAQNARIAAVRASDGHETWRHEAQNSILAAGPAGDGSGDVVAVTRSGTHVRVAGGDGSVVWETRPALDVPSAYDLGAYLARVADVNGDGVTDTVAANMLWLIGAPLTPTSRDATEIYAVDGATGDLLWLYDMGGAPASFSFHFLLDLTTLDADGDGAKDVAASGYSWNYYYATGVPGSASTYTSHLRIVDGTSTGVGVPLAVRDLPQPLLIDLYGSLSAHDADGDGSEELLVMHANIAHTTAFGANTVIERYKPAASGDQRGMVSDIQLPVASGAVFDTPFPAPGGVAVPVRWSEGLEGHLALLGAGGEFTDELAMPDAIVDAGHDGRRYVVATPGRAMFRDALQDDEAFSFPMRGAPYDMALGDRDGDGLDDLWLVSTDGNLYVLDGLTGSVLETVDRDDVVVGIRLQDADDDGVLDPYLQILKQGEMFAGLFYVYDAETHLLNSTDLKPRWRADGYAYRDTWLDTDGDGVQDFLAGWSSRYDADNGGYNVEVEIVDGRSGDRDSLASIAWDGFWFSPDAIVAYQTGDGEALFAIDGWEGIIMLDARGKLVAEELFDTNWYSICATAVDFDGDGVDSIVVVKQRFDETAAHAYDADGKREAIPLGLGSLRSMTCSLQAVEDMAGGEDLLVMAAGWSEGNDREQSIGRFDPDQGYVWDHRQKQGADGLGAYVFIGADALAPSGGRIVYGYQDHAYARTWSDGDMVAQFTANGPFVRSGRLLDLDGKRPAELVVLTSDGIAWALAEDRDAVADAVAREARRQGKELPDDFGAETLDEDAGKKSPGLAVSALLAGIVAVAAARRRQS